MALQWRRWSLICGESQDMTSRLGKAIKNSSIRTKLALLIVGTTSVALVLAGVGLLSYESYQYRGLEMREMSGLAEIVAAGSTAALSFGDKQAARETLTALHGDRRLLRAVVYDKAGDPFAAYDQPGTSAAAAPAHPRPDSAYFEQGMLLLYQPITFSGERIGTILLGSSLSELPTRLTHYAGIVAGVLAASLLLSLLAMARLQRVITGPIAYLSGVAQQVSSERNYALRAEKTADDEIGLLIDSFNDMLSQIQLREESLRYSEERYALAAQGANDGLWDWNLVTNEIYLSSRWKQMLGYTDREIQPDLEEWFGRIHPTDRERVKSQIIARTRGTEPIFASEYRIRQKKGGYIWVLCRGIVVRDPAGKIIRMAGSQSDITQGKVVDPLTGLRNRLYFIDRLEALIEECAGRADSFAILFLDVDRFKIVNDSLGHETGDMLLVEIAGRLRSSVRSTDVSARISMPSVVARFGGDEFAVLLENLHSPSDATTVAERILTQFASHFDINGRIIFGTVSIGVAAGSSANNSKDLLRNADTAMYYAKTRGKARFEVFDEGMRGRAVARMELESDLRRAIEEGHFVVHYQPEVSLRTGKVVGYEALVRWDHPKRGIVMPGEFLPLAEETGLIVPVGRWVLTEACRQMAEWHRNFPQEPPLTVSVNASSRELADPDLVANVARILQETGLNPGSLRIEVTESSIMEDHDLTAITLRRLRELDVSLEIDDFGTGYSSLSRLHEYPFSTVKIDRSFVKDLETDAESLHLVETILRLAEGLGLGVVAEGIETREQLSKLTALGCGYGQGYYFSRPADSRTTQKAIQETMREHLSVGP
ncbi:MAG: diguanylate cyclase/phosphodiesterase with sensor(s) [Bryobacterales bacterium]|nr:diguanylate cyclase/phosphodiesterase with sensor(s) [Bryobacterales bacterium]